MVAGKRPLKRALKQRNREKYSTVIHGPSGTFFRQGKRNRRERRKLTPEFKKFLESIKREGPVMVTAPSKYLHASRGIKARSKRKTQK